MAQGLTLGGVLVRTALAIVLVLGTYNPSGHSYVSWAFDEIRDFTPIQLICGIVLLGCWVLYLRAALHALGVVGVVLLAGLIAALVWLLVRQGLLEMGGSALSWVILIGVALILGIGLSWSEIRRRITGQVDLEAPLH